ncbi:MAG: UDP-glucose 4-epimerase GalE [Bacilli bacterium]|nr:UDP-glucose 4-epimerase GalE [Bacilli bacterium]
MEIKNVLVTGGVGYIGSHTVLSLIEHGYNPIIIDNLSNSSEKVLPRLEKISSKKIKFYKGDVCNKEDLEVIFKENKIDAIIHFAGLKAVGESVQKPVEYYRNNLDSTLTLLEEMLKYQIKNIIFSSSATVYGIPNHVPLTESDPIGKATNPYGQTKIIQEGIFQDFSFVHKDYNICLLRYFNPIGAHPSGMIGEAPNGIPNNLMPYITQVAVGKREKLHIFGNDYNTPDGTCIRDYVHVCDLAEGHVLSLKKLAQEPGLVIYNLGTGKGTSVLELVHAYEKATGVKIPYQIDARRPGDVEANYAATTKAEKELGFKAKFSIEDSCRDSNNWQQHNPNGYDD